MAKTLEEWLATDVAKWKSIPVGELANTYFFRDPPRPNFINNEYFFSPADGVILYQKYVNPDDAVVEIKGVKYALQDIICDKTYDTPSLVIGIFMSFYDVHINRIPYGGILTYEKTEPIQSYNKPMLAVEKDILAKTINPNNMEYLQHNERVINTINIPSLNYEYYVVQIADEDVNVIAPFKEQQELVTQNERFSLVRWGSQCELVLPLDDRFSFELLQQDTMHVEAGVDPLVKLIY